jgi:hypothetical protein
MQSAAKRLVCLLGFLKCLEQMDYFDEFVGIHVYWIETSHSFSIYHNDYFGQGVLGRRLEINVDPIKDLDLGSISPTQQPRHAHAHTTTQHHARGGKIN